MGSSHSTETDKKDEYFFCNNQPYNLFWKRSRSPTNRVFGQFSYRRPSPSSLIKRDSYFGSSNMIDQQTNTTENLNESNDNTFLDDLSDRTDYDISEDTDYEYESIYFRPLEKFCPSHTYKESSEVVDKSIDSSVSSSLPASQFLLSNPEDTNYRSTDSLPEIYQDCLSEYFDITDEQMAFHLSNKLAQVLSGESGANVNVNNSGNNNNNNRDAVNPTDIFNISKAKKIELQNLSNRLATNITQTTSSVDLYSNSIKDRKTDLPNGSSYSPDVESTLTLDYKSSTLPDQYPTPITGEANGKVSPSTLHLPEENIFPKSTKCLEESTIDSTVPCTENSPIPNRDTTPLNGVKFSGTPTGNVLKRVASYSMEKASPNSAQLENTQKRSTNIPEKLFYDSFERFEGHLLANWLTSNVQYANHLQHEDAMNQISSQICTNLIKVGVLKRISDKSDAEYFNPQQTYQWAYTEQPAYNVNSTPRKLDKIPHWINSNNTSSVVSRSNNHSLVLPKDPLATATATFAGSSNYEITEIIKRLMVCTNMDEVTSIFKGIMSRSEIENVNEYKKVSIKRCMNFSELLDASEATLYEFDKKLNYTIGEPILKRKTKDIQTDSVYVNGKCSLCGFDSKSARKPKIKTQDIGIQVDMNEQKENGGRKMTIQDQKVQKEESTDINVKFVPPPPPPPPPIAKAVKSDENLQQAPPPPPPPPPPTPTHSPRPRSSVPLPPPMPSIQVTDSGSCMNSKNVADVVAPNPPPPKPPSAPASPAPLPNPSECAWFNKANTLRKPAVNPPKPMKPLYWTRIVTAPSINSQPPSQSISNLESASESEETTSVEDSKAAASKQIWEEIDETRLDNIDEFTELFSRRATVPITKPREQKEVRHKATRKVLDSKRSQNVGIVSRSLHVDFCEIENAIYHVDTSIVTLETLQQISNIKATKEELELIKKAAEDKVPLDYPEQFLLKISQISMSTERISCIVFQSEFEEYSSVISRKLEIISQLSQFLIENEDLKLVFSIILTLGNYMNGGNRQRGQADGFTLEILGKLKDVKSTKSNITLLHFIVKSYIAKRREGGVPLSDIMLPTPEPADVERAVQVDFDEIRNQITEMKRKLTCCKKTSENVIKESSPGTLEPFKSKMEEFLETGAKTIEKLLNESNECRQLFITTMHFYQFTPKSSSVEHCTPDQFFEYWTNFSNDFKDIWKREMAALWDEIAKKSRQITNRTRAPTNGLNSKGTCKITKTKPGGLKERILRLSKK